MRKAAALVFAVAAALLLFGARREWWLTDDALITFRYVDNALAGHGLVYNLGERIEGFSNPLWVLALWLARALHFDIYRASCVLGIACTVAELGVLVALCVRARVGLVATGLSAAMFATDRMVLVWATGGLETAMHGLLVACAFAACARVLLEPDRSVVPAALALLAVAVSRPEGGVFLVAFVVLLALERRRDAIRGALNVFVPCAVALLLVRYLYYHHLLANPFRSKMAGVDTLEFGVGYLFYFLRRLGVFGLAAIVWGPLLYLAFRDGVGERRAWVRLVVAFLVAQLLAVLLMGGDYMCDFRLLRPILGVLWFGAAVTIARATEIEGRTTRMVGAALSLALVAVHLRNQSLAVPVFSDAPASEQHKQFLSADAARAERFRTALLLFAEPGDAQLADKAGLMGQGHTLRTVDATGLLSERIAEDFYPREPFNEAGARELLPGHARWPKVEFMVRERFAFIFAKVSQQPPTVAEIRPEAHRRTKSYPFVHVTIPLDRGEFFRFFTTLTPDELTARASRKRLALCYRAPWGPLQCVDGKESGK